MLAALVLLPSGAGAEPPRKEAAMDAEAVAREATQALGARRFDEVARRFDEKMAAALPAAKLGATWDGLLAQVGALRAVGQARRERSGGFDAVVLEARFERASLDVKWVFDGRGRITGLWFLPATSGAGWQPPPYAKPEAFHEREVTVGSGALALPGTLTVPSGKGPFPAALLVHGSGPNDRDETVGARKPFKDLAWGLASRGVAVLRYDKRTRVHASSFGPSARYTVKEEVIDAARDAVALLAALPEIDARRIVLVGHSQGAWLAPRIAREEPRLAGIAVLAGNTRPVEELLVEQLEHVHASPEQVAAARAAGRLIRDPKLAPDTVVDFVGAHVPGSYFLDERGYHPEQVAATLARPIFVAQGGRDYQVTMRDFAGWRAALEGKPRATLRAYAALDHLFGAAGDTSAATGPADYQRPAPVAAELVGDLAAWILALGAAK
jgi:dienelactone hydrolase